VVVPVDQEIQVVRAAVAVIVHLHNLVVQVYLAKVLQVVLHPVRVVTVVMVLQAVVLVVQVHQVGVL
jgi:hypothetical protein